ncbi:MAG: hypothetical protein DRP87_14450 [Spirochaetes bacterium]|nr:MAG: hypothetical protein DRP87_14450 [Spirochaetota bacterium]
MEIDFKTRVFDLLKAYPEIEEFLISLSPQYKKLKNPILRRTSGRMADLRHVAELGGMDPETLVNMLREQIGQPQLTEKPTEEKAETEKPAWAQKAPAFIINANELLNRGENPLEEVNKTIRKLGSDNFFLLQSDFTPSPLIKEIEKQGYMAVTVKAEKEGCFDTYIKKA